jgi:choline kinase
MTDEVIILAAGAGSRMAEITKNRPKCMAPFLDGTILSRLLKQLREYKPRMIHIVGGYKIDVLECYLRNTQFTGLPINLLLNDRYASTNSLVSAATALSKAKGQLLIFNSDVVYQRELIRRMYESPAPCAFSLDSSGYNEESEKLSVNASGRVVQIAKTISEADATGCSADLYRVNAEASNGLITQLLPRFMERPGAARRLFEDYLDQCLIAQEFSAIDITGLEWYEIDTTAELDDAEKIFKNIN